MRIVILYFKFELIIFSDIKILIKNLVISFFTLELMILNII